MRRIPFAGLSWVGLLGASLVACSVTPLGATDSGISKARSQAASGGELFDRECASCHGKRGEGLTTAPGIIGAGALPTFPRDGASSSSPIFSANAQAQVQQDVARVPGQASRAAFRNAQDVYDYVSSRMPLPRSRAGTLKPEEYWEIVNYLLIAHGAAVPSAGLTAANAKSVPLPR